MSKETSICDMGGEMDLLVGLAPLYGAEVLWVWPCPESEMHKCWIRIESRHKLDVTRYCIASTSSIPVHLDLPSDFQAR